MKTKQKLKLNHKAGLNCEAGLVLCVDTPVICAVERLVAVGGDLYARPVFNALDGNEYAPCVQTDRS